MVFAIFGVCQMSFGLIMFSVSAPADFCGGAASPSLEICPDPNLGIGRQPVKCSTGSR